MAGNRHSRPRARNTLVQPDQEGGADGAHEFSPVQRLPLPYAIGFESLARFIETRAIVSLCLDLKRSRGAAESVEMPTISVPGRAKASLQPGEIEGFPSRSCRRADIK